MSRSLRMVLLGSGFAALVFAAAFFFESPWATRLWPYQYGSLSNIFVCSILAAIGAPVLWIALSGETRAIAGGALNLACANGGIAIAALIFDQREGGPAMLGFASLAALLTAASSGLFFFSRRFAFRDTRPTPPVVRVSFALFTAMLALAGGALVTGQPNIFPWRLGLESSVFYGCIFLGAMCYFLYGLIVPVWGNAKGQLLGFLAYDFVLIAPFAAHLESVAPQMQLSLTIYLAVIGYSGLLAVYFLFLHAPTRLALTAWR